MSCLSNSIADGVASAAGSLLKLIEHAEKQTAITKKMLNRVEFESVSKSMLLSMLYVQSPLGAFRRCGKSLGAGHHQTGGCMYDSKVSLSSFAPQNGKSPSKTGSPTYKRLVK